LRHTRNLLDALLRLHPEDDWALLYFDRRGTTPGRVPLPATGARERVSRLPVRLLLTPWRMLGWPPVERWLGRIDVLYAPDLHFPPAGARRSCARSVAWPNWPFRTLARPTWWPGW